MNCTPIVRHDLTLEVQFSLWLNYLAGERVRKVWSDKKRAVSALVDLDTFDLIARIAYICEKPVKDICEKLCQEGLDSKKVLDRMSKRFRRALETGNKIYMGDKYREPFRWEREAEKRRVQMRFLEIHHERIASVAYALPSLDPMVRQAMLVDEWSKSL